MKKVYLLVGLTGSGKSTTGNCLFNKSAELDLINKKPFGASDSACGVTTSFSCAQNDKIIILDTIGFGDPQFDSNFILSEFQKALNEVNNQVNCVLFVIKSGPVTKETVDFFDIIQEKVLKGRAKNNSILLITAGKQGWIKDNQSDKFIKKALDNCNGLNYEFNLKFDDQDDEKEQKRKNFLSRDNTIKNLLAFIEKQSFDNKIDLSFIQTEDFYKEWIIKIVPILLEIMSKYCGGSIGDIFKTTASNMQENKCKTM